MEIKHFNQQEKGYFEAVEDNIYVGKLTYTWKNKTTFIADGTEVVKEFNGRNVGKTLLLTAVEYARENNLKIIPTCPFVVVMFKRMVEIQDVLSEDTDEQNTVNACEI